jgi:hypothetical protein
MANITLKRLGQFSICVFFSAAIHRGQLLRARRTAPGSMSIDRMSGTGRSGRAAVCGGLDKEMDFIVEASPSAEQDTVGK